MHTLDSSLGRSLGIAFSCLVAGFLVVSSPCRAQSWTQVQTKASPSARWQQVMSYDLITGRTVLFGGRTAANAYLSDTWEYDGTNWTQIQTSTAPGGRWLSEMVYVRSRLKSLLFGGLGANSTYYGDTWEWDSLRKTWTQLNPKTSPPARYNPALAYDSTRNRVVLFGGLGSGTGFLNDTWEWDGTNWTKVNTTTQPSARYTAMTYDVSRQRVVLYGGSSAQYDTWEYDGSNWKQMNPKNRPTARCCVSMAYDDARKRVVVFGGFTSTNLNETWEWDGQDWTQIKPSTSPSARRDFDNMVFDSRRRRMVLFGGYANNGVQSDTWEYVGPQTLSASPATVSIANGGAQTFTLKAGSQHASRLYWLFGSLTGTSPGVTLASAVGSVTIPLFPDLYTNITIALPNTAFLVKTKSALDASGQGQASLVVPKITDPNAIGLIFYHAYLVYDTSNNFYLASNPVTLQLVQ